MFTWDPQWNPHYAYDEGLERLRELHAEALALELKQLPSRMGSPHYAARAVRELCAKFEEKNAAVRAQLDAKEAEREEMRERFREHFLKS